MTHYDVSVTPHCSDEHGNAECDLGSLEYQCPACKVNVTDLGESWWAYSAWINGGKAEDCLYVLTCPACGAKTNVLDDVGDDDEETPEDHRPHG